MTFIILHRQDVHYENLFRQRALVPLGGSIDGLGVRSLLHGVGVVIDPPLCSARRPRHVMGQGVGLPDGRVPKEVNIKHWRYEVT